MLNECGGCHCLPLFILPRSVFTSNCFCSHLLCSPSRKASGDVLHVNCNFGLAEFFAMLPAQMAFELPRGSQFGAWSPWLSRYWRASRKEEGGRKNRLPIITETNLIRAYQPQNPRGDFFSSWLRAFRKLRLGGLLLWQFLPIPYFVLVLSPRSSMANILGQVQSSCGRSRQGTCLRPRLPLRLIFPVSYSILVDLEDKLGSWQSLLLILSPSLLFSAANDESTRLRWLDGNEAVRWSDPVLLGFCGPRARLNQQKFYTFAVTVCVGMWPSVSVDA